MSSRIIVPPLKIQGIKTKLVPLICRSVKRQEQSVWIEPFMGSGVVGLNIRPKKAIFADTNPHVIAFYNGIKEGLITPENSKTFLEHEGLLLQERDADHYYEVRKRFNSEHSPLDFLFLNRSCFNGMMRFNRDYEFNTPYGHKPQRFARAYITKIVNQIARVSDLIARNDWTFLCQSFEKTIAMAGPDDFIYCDPPYIGRHVDYYDSWDMESEIRLRDSLLASGVTFMLSTWEHNKYRTNETIQTVWRGCHITTQEHFYHLGAKEENRNPMVEALLTNYAVRNERVPQTEECVQLTFDLF